MTRARLRQASAIKVTVFICCYCITYATLFIFEYKYFDPGQVKKESSLIHATFTFTVLKVIAKV